MQGTEKLQQGKGDLPQRRRSVRDSTNSIEIRTDPSGVGDQQALAGARAADVQQAALPFLYEPPGVIAIGADERVDQGICLESQPTRATAPNSRPLAACIAPIATAWIAREGRQARPQYRGSGDMNGGQLDEPASLTHVARVAGA
jgi:hypothetical protein